MNGRFWRECLLHGRICFTDLSEKRVCEARRTLSPPPLRKLHRFIHRRKVRDLIPVEDFICSQPQYIPESVVSCFIVASKQRNDNMINVATVTDNILYKMSDFWPRLRGRFIGSKIIFKNCRKSIKATIEFIEDSNSVFSRR